MRVLLQIGIILTTIHVFVSLEKLNRADNQERKRSCGGPFSTNPVDKKHTVAAANDSELVKVFLNTNTSEIKGIPSLGSFISPRHVITSSQVIHYAEVMKPKVYWAVDDKVWDYNIDKTPGDDYEKVPAEYVKDIEIVYENCGYNFTCNKRAKPIEAYVLGVRTVKERYYREFLPLVLTFSRDLKHNKFFCVVSANDNFEKSEVDVYGLAGPKENLILKHRNTEVTDQLVDKRWTWVEKFFEENNRGGPMIKNISNQTTLIGIGATPAFQDGVSKNFFYNIQAYLQEVCKLTGICNDDDVSTTALTTVTTSTLPATASNQVTGYDQIETVTREPLDDEEKFKPIPDDVKTDRNAWPVMMVNVEDANNTVYEDEVKELFVSSSFLNGDGDARKRFVILFALIFYWLWN